MWACQLLGYQHPDLTLHASQVHDWYGSEDGLDLRALDADRAALEAAVAATQDALARQDDQLAELSTAWQGRGAESSQEFLRRHVEASATVAAAVRTAAEALATLRDSLWHAVDGKVAAATTIDERTQAQRSDWLAAAQTVATGAGDRAVASEVIDQSVKPFVDNDIRTDWLAAMREAMAATTDAYDAALSELGSEATAVFGVPGDLGPSWTPPRVDDTANTPAAGMTAPAAATPASLPGAGSPVWSAPAAVPPPPAPPMPSPPSEWAAPAPLLDPAANAPAAAAPSMPSPGGLGGGTPDIGSGLSGFGQQLADTLGTLFDSASGDPLPEPAEFDPADAEELDESDTIDDEPDDKSDDEPDDKLDDEPDDELERDASADMCTAEEPVEPAADDPGAEPPPPPAPTFVPEPPTTPAPEAPFEPIPPPSPAGSVEPAQTPCEIAADELPQVGEAPG